MELKDALLCRRSIRKFEDRAIEPCIIDELMHAAMSGPSACNRQPWEFYVVTNVEKLKELTAASSFTKHTAPLAIVVCGNLCRALPLKFSEYWIQDCSAATENILLRATDLGLGAVWCGVHPQRRAQQRVAEALSLSEKIVPLNIIFIGYPAEQCPPRDQYEEKYVHFVN